MPTDTGSSHQQAPNPGNREQTNNYTLDGADINEAIDNLTAMVSGGLQQRCSGPLKFTARDGLNAGTVKIEHPWGNCLAQLNPGFRPSR